MFTEDFSPLSATIGGILIGLSASLMMLTNGRVAGISGIVGGLLTPKRNDTAWRLAFLAGLILAGFGCMVIAPSNIAISSSRTMLTTAIAGVIVGVGVRMGNGCTSGHGVCGLSRFSVRSLVATCTFMFTGMLTATLIQVALGGNL